jgi:chromosome segregation ATPase
MLESDVAALKTKHDILLFARDSNELTGVSKSLEELKRFSSLTEELNYWIKILSFIPHVKEKTRLKTRLDDLKALEANMMSAYHISKVMKDNFDKLSKEIEDLSALMNALEKKKNAIDHIQRLFIGFRGWLYQSPPAAGCA